MIKRMSMLLIAIVSIILIFAGCDIESNVADNSTGSVIASEPDESVADSEDENTSAVDAIYDSYTGEHTEKSPEENTGQSSVALNSVIPPAAKKIISVNLEKADENKLLDDILRPGDTVDTAKTGIMSGLLNFIETAGITPGTDLKSMVMVDSGEGTEDIVLGRMTPAASDSIGAALGSNFSSETYRGITIYTKQGIDSAGYSHSVIYTLLVIGTADQVKDIIDHYIDGDNTEDALINLYAGSLKSDAVMSFVYEYPEDAKVRENLGGIIPLDLTQSDAVTGNIDIVNEELAGTVSLVCSNASDLVRSFDLFKGMSDSSSQPRANGVPLTSLDLRASAGGLSLDLGSILDAAGLTGHELTKRGLNARLFIKHFLYGMMTLNTAMEIVTGKTQPIIDFTVVDNPPSIYYNFIVPDDRADDLAAAIPLPDNFTLAKIRCLENETEPHYYISLNIYEVTGITTGLRAEWSTYVYNANEPGGKPRYMIIEARADNYSMDPVDIITLPSAFDHDLVGNTIETKVMDTKYYGGLFKYTVDYFESSINMSGTTTAVKGAREWLEATDYMYWSNGICDRSYFNGKCHNASLVAVDKNDCDFTDSTKWHEFINPSPESVLVFKNKLEFAISPWWNAAPDNTAVSKTTVSRLRTIKRLLYGMMYLSNAAQVMAGTMKPMLAFNVAETPPSIYVNYRVPDDRADALAHVLELPPGFALAKVKLLESDAEPHYYISLNIYRVTGITEGLRAEWSAYVTNEDDPDGPDMPRYMIIDAKTDNYSMDPVDIITMPGVMTHDFADNTISTYVEGAPGTTFQSTINIPEEGDMNYVLGSRQWLEATDLMYWRNGVADRAFYGGDLLNSKLISIGPADYSIDDTTFWSGYVDLEPESVLVFLNGLEFVVSPWWNLEDL